MSNRPRELSNRTDQKEKNDSAKRGWFERAGDEMLSWMGDDYAERRRRHDGPHRGKGPKNFMRTDDRIKEVINDRLTDDWQIDASDIE